MTKQTMTIEQAERLLATEANVLPRTSAEAIVVFNKTIKAHAELGVDDNAFPRNLQAELDGYRDRQDGRSPAERLLIVAEAKQHFGERLADVEERVRQHREAEFKRKHEARMEPMRARMREDNAAILSAPVRAVLEAIEGARRDAEASLSSVANPADVAAVAEVLDTKLREAGAALRSLRARKVA